MSKLNFSILDLAPVDYGTSAKEALLRVVDLAQQADRWGYTRYWVAEHHNMETVASSAPALLIGQIAAHTSRLKVGSGGIMLPNHSPYKVAEDFKLLEAFYPGRIDLGIGRAPGSDGRAALALRRSQRPHNADDLAALLAELQGYDQPGPPSSTNPFGGLLAMPQDVALPPVWVLGSSPYSAELAAAQGLNYAFAYHFSPGGAADALRLYRKTYQIPAARTEGATVLCVSVIAGENETELAKQEKALALKYLAFAGYVPASVLQDSENASIPAQLMPMVSSYLSTLIRVTYPNLQAKLLALAQQFQVTELMITSNLKGYENRVKLYERTAEVLS